MPTWRPVFLDPLGPWIKRLTPPAKSYSFYALEYLPISFYDVNSLPNNMMNTAQPLAVLFVVVSVVVVLVAGRSTP